MNSILTGPMDGAVPPDEACRQRGADKIAARRKNLFRFLPADEHCNLFIKH
jgi:hypothetical protein